MSRAVAPVSFDASDPNQFPLWNNPRPGTYRDSSGHYIDYYKFSPFAGDRNLYAYSDAAGGRHYIPVKNIIQRFGTNQSSSKKMQGRRRRRVSGRGRRLLKRGFRGRRTAGRSSARGRFRRNRMGARLSMRRRGRRVGRRGRRTLTRRRGRGRRTYVRARLARSIRSITGQCYNWFCMEPAKEATTQLNWFHLGSTSITANAAIGGLASTAADWSHLSRPLTGLCNTLTWWNTIANCALSAAQVAANAHVFVEGGIRQSCVIENQEPYPQFVHLFKFVLKADLVPPANGFDANQTWFDQQCIRVGGDAAAVTPSAAYITLTCQTGAEDRLPAAREVMRFRFRDGSKAPGWFWQYPQLKRYVTKKTLFKGVVRPFSRRTVNWRDALPMGGEIKPRCVGDATVPVGRKHFSYYLMVETSTPRAPISCTSQGAQYNDPGASFQSQVYSLNSVPPAAYEEKTVYDIVSLSTNGNTKQYYTYQYLPTQLGFQFYSSWACRASGDSLPTYGQVNNTFFVKDPKIATVALGTPVLYTAGAKAVAMSSRPVFHPVAGMHPWGLATAT